MSFAEVRLPGRFFEQSNLLPSFEVDIVTYGSGFEQRNLRHADPIRKGDIGSRSLSKKDYESLRDFYMARRGKWQAFRYRNPADREAVDQPLAPDGSPTVQLTKTYQDSDGNTYVRDIKKPTDQPFVRKRSFERNGSSYTPASLDITTGVLTLAKDKNLSISNVTAASPAEVTTSSNHGLSNGEEVYITGTGLGIDDQVWTVTVVNTDTVSLDGADTSGSGGASSGSLEQYPQSGDDLRWSGEFDTAVRFNGDFPEQVLAESAEDGGLVVAVDRVEIVEVKL